MTIIAAHPGFKLLTPRNTNSGRYDEEPIIAWLIDDDEAGKRYRAPDPIVASGYHSNDAAVLCPNGTVCWQLCRYSSVDDWFQDRNRVLHERAKETA